MNRLRIIPLDEEVVFPGMPVTLSVDVGSDDRVGLRGIEQRRRRHHRRRPKDSSFLIDPLCARRESDKR